MAVLVYRGLLLEAYVAVAVLMAFRVVPPECALVFPSVFAAFRLWRDMAAYSTPRRLDPSSSGRRASTSSSGCSTRQGSCSVAEEHRPFRASYLVSGIEAERIFAALLDVRRFPEWAAGLKHARALDTAGAETTDLRPGVRLEFTLSAAGITHDVASTVTVVEPSHRLEWDYVEGATGSGGWLIEDEGAGPSG